MMKKMRLFLLLSIGILFAHPSVAAVFCVSSAADIQNALTTAASNGQDDEVQIVQGTYYGNFVYSTTTEAYDLSIGGGYTTGCGTQDTDPAKTILDGNQAGIVMVFSANELNSNLSIKDLTLRNGKNLDSYLFGKGGGGLQATVGNNGSVNLEDNIISGNFAYRIGGGIVIRARTASLNNNIIARNGISTDSPSSYGAGIYLEVGSGSATLTNNTIEENYGSIYGGGVSIFAYSGTAILNQNMIRGNSSASGGGVYIIAHDTTDSHTAPSSTSLTNNVISGNTDSYQGGGIYIEANYSIRLVPHHNSLFLKAL